jgi:hypothetical protein
MSITDLKSGGNLKESFYRGKAKFAYFTGVKAY